MRNVLLISSLLFGFVSCTLVESIKETASRTKQLAGEVSEIATAAKGHLGEAKAEYAKAKAAADTDGDGKTSTSEWMTYLLGLLGVGGGGMLARNAKSNARKDVMEARLERLEQTE